VALDRRRKDARDYASWIEDRWAACLAWLVGRA
jgi:hypothetical protein